MIRRVVCLAVCGAVMSASAQEVESVLMGPGNVVEERLQRVRTGTPRETMVSFLRAMNQYRAGVVEHDVERQGWIHDAVRCLDVRGLDGITQRQTATQSAIFLKEVIDRIMAVDPEMIPDDREEPSWTLEYSEIRITRIEDGERAGEYLLSRSTVARAQEFYEKVVDLPYAAGSGMGAAYHKPWLERSMPGWALQRVMGMAMWQWIGLCFFLMLGLTMRLFVRALGALLHRLTRRTSTHWDDTLVEKEINPVALLAASLIWWGSLLVLQFDGLPLKILTSVLRVTLTVSIIWVVYAAADTLSIYLKSVAEKTTNTLDNQLVKLVSRTLKLFIILMGVLIGLQNLGINVVSLLAGLGIGGLAIALAAKDSLSNFFASIMIMLDRPFRLGHWIVVGKHEGTVEDIGFRSTKIRTFYNSLISIPNSEIANTGVDNMGLRQYRRVRTVLSITYDTPAEKVEVFVEGIKKIILAHACTRKDFFHVVFHDFGESSLDVLLYFFLEVPDWGSELKERQNVLLEIMRLAEALGVEFAFPTRTVHMMNHP